MRDAIVISESSLRGNRNGGQPPGRVPTITSGATTAYDQAPRDAEWR
jgi:hypothetical protein